MNLLIPEADTFWTAIIGDVVVLLGAAITVILSVGAARQQLSIQLQKEADARADEARSRAQEQRAEWAQRRLEQREEREARLADDETRASARRQSIATAMMSELRWVERALRDLYGSTALGYIALRAPVYDRFEAELHLFRAETIHALIQFRALLRDLELATGLNEKVSTSFRAEFTRQVRIRAGFAAQRIPELRQLLEAAGGEIPADVATLRAGKPEDVVLPPAAFPLKVPDQSAL